MKNLKNILLYSIGLAIFFASCADLSVENLNNPDTQRALSSVADLENLAANLYRNYYVDTYGYSGSSPVHAFATAADANTCSWGNVALRAASTEPREAWDNSVSFPYEYVTSGFFNNMYANLSSASDILSAVNNGLDFGDNQEMITAWAKFNQALSLSNIALTFDQGYIITEESSDEELLNPTLVPASDIAAKAKSLFDEAIAIADANSFTVFDGAINGVTVDNVLLSQIANTYAARLLAYMPRTKAENDNVDWAAVKTYASNGITSDLSPVMDDVNWWNDFQWVVAYPGWGRTDMYVANLMYPDDIAGGYPAYNANGDDFPAPDSATVVDTPEIDDRIFTDFEHLSSNAFRPERGLYHFSSFRFSRNDDYLSLWTTPVRTVSAVENEMLLAEAELELGNVPAAANIINNGSRVTRGGLPEVAATADEVRAAIHHERFVECFQTSYGLQFFEMRKSDLLQTGTFLQLPLPAKTLELLEAEEPYYTFGGSNPSSSTGGWR